MLSSDGSHCNAAHPCSLLFSLLPGLPLHSISDPWDQLPQAPCLNPSLCLCFWENLSQDMWSHNLRKHHLLCFSSQTPGTQVTPLQALRGPATEEAAPSPQPHASQTHCPWQVLGLRSFKLPQDQRRGLRSEKCWSVNLQAPPPPSVLLAVLTGGPSGLSCHSLAGSQQPHRGSLRAGASPPEAIPAPFPYTWAASLLGARNVWLTGWEYSCGHPEKKLCDDAGAWARWAGNKGPAARLPH